MKPVAKIEEVTKEQLQKAFPSKKSAITDELVEIFNKSQSEPEFQGESLLQTAITYEQVMQNNRMSIREYVDAIRFCAYMISVDDNITEAYIKTFSYRPFVYEKMHMPKDSPEYGAIMAAASRYRKENRAVRDILSLSQVPFELMFGGARMKAVMVLADIMENGRFDRDRINAAKELLAATKSDTQKVTLEVGPNAAAVGMMQSLNDQLAKMAEVQQQQLLNGGCIKDVQKIGININQQEDIVDVEAE